MAEHCATAAEVVDLYNEFLADTSIGENDCLSAKNNLSIWEGRAAKKMVHYGNHWMESQQTQKYKGQGGSIGAGSSWLDCQEG